MKKVVFTSLIFASYLFGTSIENIVQKSLQNNFDIKSLENSIEIANFQIKQAKNWENPMISFKANDIMLNKNYLNNQKSMELSYLKPYLLVKDLNLKRVLQKKINY